MSNYVTFDDISLLKSTVSQQVERMKTKNVSQQVEVDATPLSLVGSVPVEISPDMTPGENRVAVLDTEYVYLIVAKKTKLNPRK